MPVVFEKAKKEGALNRALLIPLSEREGSIEEWVKKEKAAAPKPKPLQGRLTMKVRMIADKYASEDGINVKLYEVGKAYDVPADLAEKWLKTHLAEEDKMLPGPAETKAEIKLPPTNTGKPKKRGRK